MKMLKIAILSFSLSLILMHQVMENPVFGYLNSVDNEICRKFVVLNSIKIKLSLSSILTLFWLSLVLSFSLTHFFCIILPPSLSFIVFSFTFCCCSVSALCFASPHILCLYDQSFHVFVCWNRIVKCAPQFTKALTRARYHSVCIRFT